MEIDRKEALRYLGYGNHEADPATAELLEECIRVANDAADFRYAVREYPLTFLTDSQINCGCFLTNSKNLSRNLKDCGRVLVMAATLGTEVDRLLLRYGKLAVTKAVVLQAVSAAMIEAHCNALCAEWKREYEAKGLYLRPRFSPGYGDFPLSVQAGLLSALDAGKRLGITLTERNLMLPSKSVTAVIGISKTPANCMTEGCEACKKTDCAYRR